MAVAYQNKAENETWGTSFTLSAPTGFSAGDLFIACVSHDNSPATSHPSGWTVIQDQASGTAVRFSVLYRIAETGDTNWNWTVGSPVDWIGCILRYTGQAETGFLHASNNSTGSSSAPISPSVSYTGLNAGSLVLQCFGADDDDTPYTTPSPLTERFNDSYSFSGGCGHAGGDDAISGTGSTGTATFSMNASEQWVAVTVVIDSETTIIYETVSDTMVSSVSTDMEFILEHSISGTHTPTLEGLSFETTKALTELSNFSLIDPFTLLSTQSLTESSIFTQPSKLGVTKSLSSSNTPTTELLFELVKTLSTVNSLSIPSLSYEITKELTSSNTPSIIKDLSYTLAPSIIESNNLSLIDTFSFLLTQSLAESSSLAVPSLVFGSIRTLTSSCTPTLSKLLTLILSQSFTESSNLSALSKFILESAASGTYIPTAADLLILLAVISTSSTSTPTLSKVFIYHLISSFQSSSTFSSFIKFILEKAAASSYTPTIVDIYTLIDLISTTINNISGVSCKFKLITSDTGLGTPSVSSILGKHAIVSFEIQGTSSLTKVMDYSPIITFNTTVESFIAALQILFHEEASSGTGTPTVDMKDLLEVLFSETSSLTSSLKFSLLQSLSQTTTPTVDKIISFIKDIEMSSTSSLSIEDILEFILTVPLSTSQNITIEDIQILIDLISTSTQENLSINIKNILNILLQETSILSHSLKYLLTKTLTNSISSTIDVSLSYQDTILFTIENILLVTVLEELAKLILTLEDSQITGLILSDTQLKDLTLEDSQITGLILEDL